MHLDIVDCFLNDVSVGQESRETALPLVDENGCLVFCQIKYVIIQFKI